jgi:DNA replication protein DnaD
MIYDYIKKSMANIISKRDNTYTVECMCKSLQQFDKDGIHLTEDSGICFIEDILSKSEKAFKSVTVNLTTDNGDVTIESTNRRIDDMVGRLTMRFDSDNLMFARIREELDSAANLKREDRVVVNGITCKQPLPHDSRQRLEKLKELVMEIFIAIKPEVLKTSSTKQDKLGVVGVGEQVTVRVERAELELVDGEGEAGW